MNRESELVQLVPDLALHFLHFVPLPLPQTLDPEQKKHRHFTILTYFFTRQAAQQPVLIIVEDLHWCDDSSFEMLLHLIRHCTSQPIFLFFTYHSEEASPGRC
jgi:predicted ATPase